MEQSAKSVYLRGAENGAPLGVYFSIMFIAMVAGEKFAAAGLLSTLMMFGVPVTVWYMLRRTFIAEHGETAHSVLWMQGIVAFAGGGLILCAAVYVYMRFIDPELVSRQVDLLLGVYGGIDNPRTQEMTEMLQTMKEGHLLPSVRDIVVQLFLMTVFSGSILSMLISFLIRLRGLNVKEKNK